MKYDLKRNRLQAEPMKYDAALIFLCPLNRTIVHVPGGMKIACA